MELHDHSYSGVTSFNAGHIHRYEGRTTFVPDRKGHIHYLKGITTFNDGHVHGYSISTSVDFPAPGGDHYHVFRTIARPVRRHIHLIRDITSVD